jgi:hypothetical protein
MLKHTAIAFIYIKRLERVCPVTHANVKGVYILALWMAIKYMMDYAIYNVEGATFTLDDQKKFNKMEIQFCKLLGWNFHVSTEEYFDALVTIEKDAVGKL